jgi:hypothetical protein
MSRPSPAPYWDAVSDTRRAIAIRERSGTTWKRICAATGTRMTIGGQSTWEQIKSAVSQSQTGHRDRTQRGSGEGRQGAVGTLITIEKDQQEAVGHRSELMKRHHAAAFARGALGAVLVSRTWQAGIRGQGHHRSTRGCPLIPDP